MSNIDYGFAKQALGHRGSRVKRTGDSYSLRVTSMVGIVSQLNMVPEVWRPISRETVERLLAEGYLKAEDIIEEDEE